MNKTPNKRKSPSQPKSKITKKDSFAVKENFQDGQSIWFKYPLFWIPFASVFSIVVWILATKEDASIFSFSSLYNHWPSLTWRAAKVVFTWLALELLLLVVVPGKREQGPHAPSGYRPTYRANGVACYVIVNALVLAANYMGVISLSYVYDILGEIFMVSNVAALFFCLFLYFKGIYFPSSDDVAVTPGFKNFSNEYFWGIELHPSIMGIEIKQLINCRYAMMGWQMLLWVYAAKQYTLYGHFSNAMIVSVLLQTAYIFKFFNWEVGYFHTIDIAHDKLGFYICWGCCAWLPPTYTVPAMYMASHPGTIGVIPSVVITAIGLLSIYLNYETDLQKQYTRQHNGNNLIWGRKPKVMRVKYNSFDGVERENILLIDGYWSYARHLNYVFELALAFCWTLPAGFSTVVPYIYFLQLTALLVDRTHRDNTRCSIKYGNSWKEYCKVVKYNMIPGVF